MGQRDHWLRLNAANRVPRRLVTLNAQAWAERAPKQIRYTYRTGAGALTLLGRDGLPTEIGEPRAFATTAELWAAVASWTAPSHRTVLFAYNLPYLLRLTDALERLDAEGFDATRVVLSDYSCWARFAKGGRTLMLCDLRTWIPASPAMIAGDLNRPAPRAPKIDADPDAWDRYTIRNQELVRAASLNLLRWLHEDNLGDFRPTGHAQATAAFRHRFLDPRTILVHWGADPREAERRSAWTGRAEVWRPGKHGGPIAEYDYTAAYAWIAEHESLPTRLLGEIAVRNRRELPAAAENRAYLLEVDVETETPIVPTHLDGRILWPVGTFRTVLWDVEARLAVEEGARLTIRRAWLYESAPVLRRWARWVLACLDGKVETIDPLRRRVVKAWSRALIGRFALRYPNLEPLREEDRSAVRITTVWDDDLGRGVREVQIGKQVFNQDGVTDGADSSPQIMAAVMAHARVRLWRTMQAAGLDHVLYLDTDSVLVDAEGARRIDGRLRQGHFPGLRLKGTYKVADLRAPRNLDLDEERRVAGLPRDAARMPDGRYRAEVWEGFGASLRRSRPSGVFRLARTFTVGHEDNRRRHLADGTTEPYRLDDGRLVPHE